MSISRRTFFKGVAGAVGMGLLPASQLHAQTTNSNADVAAFFRFKLGSYDMITIYDDIIPLPVYFVGVNVPGVEVREAIDQMFPVGSGDLTATILNLVLIDGDRIAIFDTGNGTKLVPTLEAAGITPDQVTDVIISHYHPDHIGGLSNGNTLTFPNAMVHFPQVEYDYMQEAPSSVVSNATRKLQPALDAEQVTFFAPDAEVMAGVQAIASPGHTPGHANFLINSGTRQLIHLADTAVSPYGSLPHPEWHFGADTDPVVAVESRIAILSRLSDERIQAFGYHYSFPGLGYAMRQGQADSWWWVPVAF